MAAAEPTALAASDIRVKTLSPSLNTVFPYENTVSVRSGSPSIKPDPSLLVPELTYLTNIVVSSTSVESDGCRYLSMTMVTPEFWPVNLNPTNWSMYNDTGIPKCSEFNLIE